MAQFTSDNLTPEVGARLREARIAKGLSEADAAARLRTTPHYIERMDAGDVRSLPPEPYRKSFIKEYARLVGLKLDVLLSGEPASEPRSEGGILGAVSAVPEVAKKVTKEAASLATEVTKTTVKTTETVVKKAGEGMKEAVQELRGKELWEEAEQVRRERLGIKEAEETPELRMRPQRSAQAPPSTPPPPAQTSQETLGESTVRRTPISERRQPTQRLDLDKEVRREAESYEPPESEEYELHTGPSRSTKVIVGLLIVIAAVVAYSVISKRAKNTPPEPVVTEAPKVETKQPPAKPAPTAEKKKDTTAAAAVPPPVDSSLKFTLTAKEDVWVSVTPDVGNGFRGTMKAGETKQFSAKEKYILYLGNQKSVGMTLNGKPLSGLPTVPGSNMVVRNVLLTRDKAVPASPDQNPTEIKKQALKSVTPPPTAKPKPQVKQAEANHPHPAAKKPEVRKPAPKKPAPRKANQPIRKQIPTTPPVLPQAN
ncbi:MAG: helix-turn-helix domain-containing protein [Bacteroidetes bacterium]|nr:helix-turn-helix domain-containing protein [Bacteroidota bacterium]